MKSVRLTCGIALNDWQVIHLQSGITPTPRKLHYVVFAVIYKLWRLLDVNVVRSDIEHNSNVPFLLKRQEHRRGVVLVTETVISSAQQNLFFF